MILNLGFLNYSTASQIEYRLLSEFPRQFHDIHFNPQSISWFVIPSSQGWTLPTEGQAAGNHYSIKNSADGSNALCTSVNTQEVYKEDLNLGEGCATQSVQHLGTAIGVTVVKSLFESELQSKEGNSRLCVGGICTAWYVHAQSPKGKNIKCIRQPRCFVYL